MNPSEPISWDAARSVASRVNGYEPFSSSYLLASCQHDLLESSSLAAELVEAETGLVSALGDLTARIVTRDEWVDVNLRSFQRLVGSTLDRVANSPTGGPSLVGRTVTGAQLGLVLGWASTRVLGQYDFTLPDDERPQDHDVVYYVAPNVLALEKRYAFPPREFRLWLAVHELTHRAQFTGVSWMPAYFQSLVAELLAELEEPKVLGETIKRAAAEVRHGSTAIKDGGVMAMLATPTQQEVLSRVAGLMALLEGHAEVIMSRAGVDQMPNADRFHRVLHERRNKAGMGKLIQKVLGFDAKLRQYAEGKQFVLAVEASGGAELLNQVWAAPENLPTSEEIRSPERWLARLQSPVGADQPSINADRSPD